MPKQMDPSQKKMLIHLTKQDAKNKIEIKSLEKRFTTFTKFNKKNIEILHKKIDKLEKKLGIEKPKRKTKIPQQYVDDVNEFLRMKSKK